MAVTFEVGMGGPATARALITPLEEPVALPPGSYTALRTYGGNGVVRLGQHVRRLVESLPPGTVAALDPAVVRAGLALALRATGFAESRARLTFAPPRLFVTVEPFAPLDESLRRDGVACVTVSAHRERPEAKDTGFLATARAAYDALPAGIHEGLLVGDDGAILEGLSSNFFGVRGGRLRTEETRALRGVTRAMVLDLARGVLPLGEGALRLDELPSAGECFITSVSREVLPVAQVNGMTIGGGAPGPVTKEIMRRFAGAIAAEVERLQPVNPPG